MRCTRVRIIRRLTAACRGRAQVALESNGRIDKRLQYELVTGNLEKLLGMQGWLGDYGDLVIYQSGGAFNMSSKVIAVASPRHGAVELF